MTAPQSTSKTQVSSKKSNEGGRYFVTVPRFETYDARYKWLKNRFFIGYAACTSHGTLLTFYEVLGSLACFCLASSNLLKFTASKFDINLP
ncbi:DUF3237 family protein [Campylobacter rectus]|uniref:DUF3237 family protein n=1 Tax=Campylobacter rectus TaxID=203 RepID=UPI000309317A|nr:DUF3237 family protein [Campylobacter rectus]UEB47542.1 DUF3237 family protein [Campylobacter rectus]